jgi:hypothetical protein
MSMWFCKNLGDAMLAFLVLDRIEAACQSAYEKAYCPDELAVFLRHESEGRLHCEVEVCFSLALALIAEGLDTAPCEQPTKYGLSLLVGTPTAWSTLFAES